MKDGMNEKTIAPGAGDCGTCPLAKIPAAVWKDILRRPFRKRHPWVFWIGCLALLGVCLSYFSMDEPGERIFGKSERIALVTVRGLIMDVSGDLAWIREIERKPWVKGVLLRVDSPGGGAAASQEVYDALAGLALKMPVAASMGSVAASGGLMVSMAAERIFANASTVTGSVGVRMDIPQLQGLFDKIGVGQETLVTAPYKNAGSYTRPLAPEERAYFEGVLADMHAQFIDIVAKGRGMPRERAQALANGKIFTGREAKDLGLVDELGGQEEAHHWLAEKSGVPYERGLLTRPKENHWIAEGLKSLLGIDIVALNGAALYDPRSPVFLYRF